MSTYKIPIIFNILILLPGCLIVDTMVALQKTTLFYELALVYLQLYFNLVFAYMPNKGRKSMR